MTESPTFSSLLPWPRFPGPLTLTNQVQRSKLLLFSLPSSWSAANSPFCSPFRPCSNRHTHKVFEFPVPHLSPVMTYEWALPANVSASFFFFRYSPVFFCRPSEFLLPTSSRPYSLPISSSFSSGTTHRVRIIIGCFSLYLTATPRSELFPSNPIAGVLGGVSQFFPFPNTEDSARFFKRGNCL